MDQPDREAEPYFSQPTRQIFLMLLVLSLVGAGAYLAYPAVGPVFLANPWLNGAIAFVFFIGVLACFWQVLMLISSVNWIVGLAANRPGHENEQAPRLLAPLAALLRSRGSRTQITATSARSILDSVAQRVDEARDITRYIVNLLIFLGLLGTFYGLATTVPAVVETIRSLAPQGDEGAIAVFNRLMVGLEKQLGGMGVAFSSSLIGLAGSLVVGLLELFVSHGQNRFYRELEEWMSTITRFGFASDSEQPGEGAASTAAMEYMAEQMENLQQMFTQSDISRAMVDERLSKLADSVDSLTAKLSGNGTGGPSPDALNRIAEGQERVIAALENGGAHVDAESRMRLRSIDVQLLRILEEMAAGRQESTADLRSDISALTRAIREASGQPVTPSGRRG